MIVEPWTDVKDLIPQRVYVTASHWLYVDVAIKLLTVLLAMVPIRYQDFALVRVCKSQSGDWRDERLQQDMSLG